MGDKLCSRRRLPHPRHDWMIGDQARYCPGWPRPNLPTAHSAEIIEAAFLDHVEGVDMRQVTDAVAQAVDRLTVAKLIVPPMM